MADNENQNIPRGNEWEVVSMIGSAYDEVPGSEKKGHDRQGDLGEMDGAEASSPMIMSGHFVFPPSQHENLPLEPEFNEMNDERGGMFDVSHSVEKMEDVLDVNNEKNVSSEYLNSDEFPGIVVFDERGNTLSTSGADSDKENSNSSTTEFRSSDLEATMDTDVKEDEGAEDISISQHDTSVSGFLDPIKTNKGEKHNSSGLPCEAWWKRRAITLYAQAKEANTFWSVCIAATVMGLVIIGHQWQQERWQVLHLRWLSGISDQRMSRILGPITRVKDVIVNGHRRGSLIRGSTSSTEL